MSHHIALDRPPKFRPFPTLVLEMAAFRFNYHIYTYGLFNKSFNPTNTYFYFSFTGIIGQVVFGITLQFALRYTSLYIGNVNHIEVAGLYLFLVWPNS